MEGRKENAFVEPLRHAKPTGSPSKPSFASLTVVSPNARPASPNDKPALRRQRDHSACGRPETPLRVRKTRENLRNTREYADIPPPCAPCGSLVPDHKHYNAHGSSDVPPASLKGACSSVNTASSSTLNDQRSHKRDSSLTALPVQLEEAPVIQRHKSVSRRMLSMVKQGLANRTKSTHSVRPNNFDVTLAKKTSIKKRQAAEIERRAYSFEISRESIISDVDGPAMEAEIRPVAVQRSFTDSTVSTGDILSNLAAIVPPKATPPQSREAKIQDVSREDDSPEAMSDPTPKPREKRLPPVPPEPEPNTEIEVPYVDLRMSVDITSIDTNSKQDIWIAIIATVRSHRIALKPGGQSVTASTPLGAITGLRIVYKPDPSCEILEVVGHKSMKDPQVSETCSLFVKLRVSRMRQRSIQKPESWDQDDLFAELESMVGTLETEVLHVECRYKHSLIEDSNTVTVRRICRIIRPKSDSRWSLASSVNVQRDSSVHVQLAQYIAGQCEPTQALQLIEHYLGSDAEAQPVKDICIKLELDIRDQTKESSVHRGNSIADKPSILISDTSLDDCAQHSPSAPSGQYSTTPLADIFTPQALTPRPTSSISTAHSLKRQPTTATLKPRSSTPFPNVTTTDATASPTTSSGSDTSPSPTDSNDSARQIWHNIRHASLSTLQRLVDQQPETLQQLEASDEVLRELRRKAVSNKRSVGAETLRNWKWEEKRAAQSRQGGDAVVGPWM